MIDDLTHTSVPLNKLRETKTPLRQEPTAEKIEAVAEDLKTRGQQTALLVTPDADGTYVVIDGRVRMRAMQALEKQGYELAAIQIRSGDETRVLLTAADGNLGRKLSAAEQALNIRAIDQETDPKELGVCLLRDGRGAGAQHQPGLNAVVKDRFGLSQESATKATYRARVPLTVLYEVLGTEQDRAERLTQAGRAAVKARENGADPAAAARAKLNAGSRSARRDDPGVKGFAKTLNNATREDVRAIAARLYEELDTQTYADLLQDLQERARETDKAAAAANENDQTVVQSDPVQPTNTKTDTERGTSTGAPSGRNQPAGHPSKRGGGAHNDGGPKGGTVENKQRVDRIQKRIRTAKQYHGGLAPVAEKTGVAQATLSSLLNGRYPAAHTADKVERTLPPAPDGVTETADSID